MQLLAYVECSIIICLYLAGLAREEDVQGSPG